MRTEKAEWEKLRDLHAAEMITTGGQGRGGPERPRSHGAVYGPSESNVDQVGDGLIDVNHLMARFERMPTAEELQAAGLTSGGFYADFTDVPDYEKALQISNAAKNQFALLPAGVRGRFENDPRQFLAFVHDPANNEELIRMGIKTAPAPKPEPEVTLKDVRDAIKGAAAPQNPAGKG